MLKEYTRAEVALHNTENDLWVIIENRVYDLTSFARFHPGGKPILIRSAGKECTAEFKSYHNSSVLQKYEKLVVGVIAKAEVKAVVAPYKYAEPAWHYSPSPYYTDFHRQFQKKVRAFVDVEILPFINEWEKAEKYPPELRKKAVDAGLYAAIYPKEYGGTPPNGQSYDAFCDMILIDELSRCGAGGLCWSVFWSFGIAIPPILAYGDQWMKDTIIREVLTGQKNIALCVTEPEAGSNVSNVQTTAELVENNTMYKINGTKRYITGGILADYYTVVCKAKGGPSMVLVPRDTPGVTVKKQNTQGWLTSNTAVITFSDVMIPVKNLIGKEGKGLIQVYENFVHERFTFATSMLRFSRVMLADAVDFVRHRITFNKALSQHQVIRHKIAEMTQRVEALQAYGESIAYQMSQGRINDIPGEMALYKARASECMEFVAKEAMQCLGGCAYIRGGAGDRIERLYREVHVNRCAGGSYEMMHDLAMKQAKL